MQKLKQGDEVIVLVGKDKGKRGRISKFLKDKILVEGVNQVKKTPKTKSKCWSSRWHHRKRDANP